MHTLISVADLVPKDVKQEMTHEEDGNHDDEEYPRDESLNTWANHGFIKPLRAIMELSGFPVLTWLYKILVTLAVTSCSAERAMSIESKSSRAACVARCWMIGFRHL